MLVVVIKRKPEKISCSSFACWELSRVNSFILFVFLGPRGEDHDENVEVALICIIVDLKKEPILSCLLLFIECLQITA